MFVLARALTFASLFIAFVLVFVPARLLQSSGIGALPAWGIAQVIGVVLVFAGGALAIWCVLAFATLGRGTPAPFDPPRLLVVRGPYKFVRNPMYLGASAALAGAALFYESWSLLAYLVAFALAMHAFVIWYEEPTLTRTFGADYTAYRATVHRWLPTWRGRPG